MSNSPAYDYYRLAMLSDAPGHCAHTPNSTTIESAAAPRWCRDLHDGLSEQPSMSRKLPPSISGFCSLNAPGAGAAMIMYVSP